MRAVLHTVQRTPTKSRKHVLLFIILVGIVMFLGMLLLSSKRTRPLAETSGTSDSLLQTSERFTPVPLRQPDITYLEAPTPPQSTVFKAHPAIDARLAAYLKPPWQDAFVPSGSRSTTFGVVDLYRLVTAHPPDTNSPDAQARLLRDIRDSVAARAHVHGFSLVFDISANSVLNIPIVLATNNPVDITTEVLEDLSR